MISTWQLGRECNQSTPQKVKCGSCGEKEVVKGILDETLAKLNSICLPHSRSESSNDQGILGHGVSSGGEPVSPGSITGWKKTKGRRKGGR